ncbi:MAG: large subunit ribosomal protein [Acidimicrobiaceae bacterium]|jgi:ribosomal protein L22
MADETEKTEPEATEPEAEAKPAAKKPAARKRAAKKAEPKAEAVAEATEEEAKPAAKKPARKPAAKKPATPKAEDKPADAAKPAPSVNGRVQVRAHAKYVRTSARKARLVCDHIRGKTVEEAFAILAHTPRHVADDWRKLLQSAVANAEHNHELLGDDLRIASVKADEGPTLKRFRPRAMGRATKIRKRTSHLTITLTPKD